jgi:hypothetical protein
MCRSIERLVRPPLCGVVIGAALALISTYAIEMQKQKWTARNMAAAFVGEISAIVETQNKSTNFFKGILAELEKGKEWAPIDQPDERFFTVYEAAASNLGVLDSPIVLEIARFYSLENTERARLRILGAGDRGYMKFEIADKKVFLNGYVALGEKIKQSGQKIIDALQRRYDLKHL